MQTLGDYFVFYLGSDDNMDAGFWTEVAELWNDWEGGNLTNNAVRKRFKRRAKAIKEDITYIDELSDELYVDNLDAFRQDVQDTLLGEKSAKNLNNEVKSKTNFTEKAQEMGVKSEYQRFLEKNKIDPDDVTNVYFKEKAEGVRFTVQTRFNNDEIDFDPLDVFRQSLREYKIPEDYSSKFQKQEPADCIGMISLFDAHLTKIASISETDKGRTVEDNIKMFRDAFDKTLESIKIRNPEIIVFPTGQDLFNTNDFRRTTKKGTLQHNSTGGNLMDNFRLILNLIRECIDKCRHVAPVTVINIAGNHDESRVQYLNECLLVAYENQKDVTIKDSRKSRQYLRYGDWLFGWAHSDKVNNIKEFPNLMANDKESRQHWADIKQGVFFLGHVHRQRKYEGMKSEDFRGCEIKVLRATSPTDKWSFEKGYVGIPKTCYGFVYKKNAKQDSEIRINI